MFRATTKTFNLLSIGHRAVGKTVFLAGSYAELHSDSQTASPQQLWFDCQNSQVQENIESILNYIAQTGQYPPATVKITNFNFSLKLLRHSQKKIKTLSHFSWADIPGEYCNLRNIEFYSIAATSHGCCVFIDAYALLHNNAYLQVLEDTIKQVMAIAKLAYLNGLEYAFAVILTKCDLLKPGLLTQQQLKEGLQPLTTRLDAAKANYQIFYSFAPIVNIKGVSTLKATGAAAPLLWLVLELNKAHNPRLMNNLLELVTPLMPSYFPRRQEGDQEGLQSIYRTDGKAFETKNMPGVRLLPTVRRNILLVTLGIVSLLGVISFLSVDYKRFLQGRSNNLDTLENRIALLQERGHFYQALPLMEKLVQQEPQNLELRLQLAQLYEVTGQVYKAETAYDRVLAQQKNNLLALVSKALLRYTQGDIKTAQSLFAQAEKAAPTDDAKRRIHALAQKKMLQHSGLPNPPAK